MARPKLTVIPSPDSGGEQQDGYRWQTADVGAARPAQWLLPNRITANGLCVLEGDPSSGKSTLLAHVAAAVTTGHPWMGRGRTNPGNVLWLSGEEEPLSMIRPRLVAAGCDLTRVRWPEADEFGVVRPLYFPGSVQVLSEAVLRYDLSMIVIEPLVSFVPHDVSLNQEGPARSVCDPLNQLALRTGCCIIVTRGLRKDRSGPRILHGSGHGTISNTARSVLVIDRPDPESERRVLRVVKCPQAGGRTPAIEYLIDHADGPRMVKLVALSGEADDAAGDQVDPGERDVRADARTLLRQVCATEYVPVRGVLRAAEESGIGERTLRKVKAELRIHSRWMRLPPPGYHEWGPPLGGWPAAAASPPVQPTKRAALPKTPRKSRKKAPE